MEQFNITMSNSDEDSSEAADATPRAMNSIKQEDIDWILERGSKSSKK